MFLLCYVFATISWWNKVRINNVARCCLKIRKARAREGYSDYRNDRNRSYPLHRILRMVLAKHCSVDPVPTWLVKKLAEDIIPVICRLCNTSLDCCHLSDDQKLAVVRPRLKKSTLDASHTVQSPTSASCQNWWNAS